MRVPKVVFSIFFAFVLTISLAAQQTITSNPQALSLLQRSLNALSAGQSVPSDVTLSGTARRIAGSDDDTGTAVLRAISSGASRIDLSLSSGQRSEILNTSVSPAAGSWSGPDGVTHFISNHNLLTGPAWFFPVFPIVRALSQSGYVATYVGHEMHNGQAVEHVAVSQTFPPGIPSLQHLTQIDFFLDASTHLPAALTFNVHPDNDMGLDIPIEIRFSDYRGVNGVQVPFRVQKYLNNGLVLDLQFQSVVFNTGLTSSSFSAQ